MDSAPTALFDSYEADFKQIIHSIRGKLDGDAKDVQGEQRKAALRRVEMELDEADEMVRVVLLSMFVFKLLYVGDAVLCAGTRWGRCGSVLPTRRQVGSHSLVASPCLDMGYRTWTRRRGTPHQALHRLPGYKTNAVAPSQSFSSYGDRRTPSPRPLPRSSFCIAADAPSFPLRPYFHRLTSRNQYTNASRP